MGKNRKSGSTWVVTIKKKLAQKIRLIGTGKA